MTYKPIKWQLDSHNLTSKKVQFWRNGIMLTQMPLQKAIEMVDRAKAFVINGQAIGALSKDGNSLA